MLQKYEINVKYRKMYSPIWYCRDLNNVKCADNV